MTVLPYSAAEQLDKFQIVLEDPDGGAALGPEQQCVLTVTIRQSALPEKMADGFK